MTNEAIWFSTLGIFFFLLTVMITCVYMWGHRYRKSLPIVPRDSLRPLKGFSSAYDRKRAKEEHAIFSEKIEGVKQALFAACDLSNVPTFEENIAKKELKRQRNQLLRQEQKKQAKAEKVEEQKEKTKGFFKGFAEKRKQSPQSQATPHFKKTTCRRPKFSTQVIGDPQSSTSASSILC